MKPRELLRQVPIRVLVVMTCGIFGKAHADNTLDEWQITGSNTLRLESYRVQGDPLTGPYRFTGGQHFDEFNLNMTRQLSPYDSLRAQLYGVANDSYYRAPDHGLVPERINVMREKGDSDIPFRVEAGDNFAYFSFRTLQRSLKGGQIELQPVPGESGARHSLLLISGTNQPNWRHVQGNNDWTNGASWLIEASPQTRFSVNLVHNFRQSDPVLGTLDRTQTVTSATGEYGWLWGSQNLRIEGELAGLRGDHDGYLSTTGTLSPQSGQNRSGNGVFGQISGQSTDNPLDYRLRFERYDRDYRPAGGVIAADRLSEEAHIGWRFSDGAALRGRAQHFNDGLQSGNALKTDTYGINWSGSIVAAAGLSGSVDLFSQNLTKGDATIDRGTWNINANLAKPFPEQWVGNLGLLLQQVNDRVPGASDSTNAQLQLNATHQLNMGGWGGSLTPGITLHRLSGNASATTEWIPALAFSLANLPHSLSASYGYQKLRPDAASLATVEINALRVDYRYVTGKDTFGIEASSYDRRVTIGQYNDSYRLSLFWTYAFDKPAQAAAHPLSNAPADTAAMLSRNLGLLLEIVPGSDFSAMARRMEASGMPAGTQQGQATIYEQRLIGDLTERQRLAITHERGSVSHIALVLNLNDPNNPQDVAQTYERVRKAMLDRFGRPSFTFEEGTISSTFVADLNANRVIRTMEWSTESGKLRLGIPRRLDGQIRIEVQHAKNFGAPRDTLWSIDEVH